MVVTAELIGVTSQRTNKCTTPLTGQDSETYLNVVRAVVETQDDEAFYSIRKIHGPLRDIDPYISPAVSLRHSAYPLLCGKRYGLFSSTAEVYSFR